MTFGTYKKAKENKEAKSNKKISIMALIGISILAIFSFKNIVDNYIGLGLSAVVAFLIAIIVYLLPFSFIIAELATIKIVQNSKSGLTKWIEVCMGRKTSFITSYMFWFANLFYFVGALPSAINNISFGVTGQDFTSDSTFKLVNSFLSVAFFAIITFISTFNTKKISKITSVGGTIILGLTFLFFIVSIIAWIVGAAAKDDIKNILPNTQAPGLIENEKLNFFGDSQGINFAWMSTFIWVLMAADGAQSLGAYVGDVKGGSKGFSKGIIWSILLIGITYIVGTLLVSVFPPVVNGSGGLSNGTYQSFINMFYFIFVKTGLTFEQIKMGTLIIIGLLNAIASIGGILIWTSAPVRTFFSEIPSGVFGSTLPKQNRNGVPVLGAWIQFIIVAPLLLIPALGLESLNDFFNFIKTASGWIGMIPPLIIFLSYFNLRLNKDYLERDFRMGNRIIGLIISGIMIVIFVGILIVTFLDVPLDKPVSEWNKTWWISVVYKVACLLILVLPIYLWYLRYEKISSIITKAKQENKDGKITFFKNAYISKSNKKLDSFYFNDELQKYNDNLWELNNKTFNRINNFDFKTKTEYLEFKKEYFLQKKLLKEEYLKEKNSKYKLLLNESTKINNQIKNIKLNKSTIVDDSITLNKEFIKSFSAIRKGLFAGKNVLDNIYLYEDGVSFNYFVNGEFESINFDFNNSKILFESGKDLKVFISEGKKIEMHPVRFVRINGANLVHEILYIENVFEFRKLLEKYMNNKRKSRIPLIFDDLYFLNKNNEKLI